MALERLDPQKGQNWKILPLNGSYSRNANLHDSQILKNSGVAVPRTVVDVSVVPARGDATAPWSAAMVVCCSSILWLG